MNSERLQVICVINCVLPEVGSSVNVEAVDCLQAAVDSGLGLVQTIHYPTGLVGATGVAAAVAAAAVVVVVVAAAVVVAAVVAAAVVAVAVGDVVGQVVAAVAVAVAQVAVAVAQVAAAVAVTCTTENRRQKQMSRN